MVARTTITVCTTCSFGPDEKLRDGLTGGETLAGFVEDAARAQDALAVRRHACLMGCKSHCAVAISAPAKMTYVLGRFEPGAAAASAIVDYAALYADSIDGVVSYRSWPDGVKGHFLARVPPLPAETAADVPAGGDRKDR
ncbi:MAG: DUF1636 domain-containing protein [Pseudomonadota bacterium]